MTSCRIGSVLARLTRRLGVLARSFPLAALIVGVAAALILGAMPIPGPFPRPSPVFAADDVTLDKLFKGNVSINEKKKIVTIRYDFSNKDQLKDWEDGAPLRIMGESADKEFDWFDGQMQIPGTRSSHHKAVWTGDVSITATYRPDATRDVGCWIAPADGENDYCTFTLTEHYFHKWNGKTGGVHSIIQFGDQWREGDSGSDFVGFRYVDRKPPPEDLKPGRPFTFTASWIKKVFHFEMGKKFHLKGKPKGRTLKDVTVGFYTVVSRLLVDDVTITGKLNAQWLAKQGAVLKVDPNAGTTAAGLPADLELLVNGHKAGKITSSGKLVSRLAAGGDSPAVRQAIIGALSVGPKAAVRAVIELLYSPEESIRAEGAGIVKSLLGKTYGYKSKAKEASRSRAIKKLNSAIDKDPKLLQD